MSREIKFQYIYSDGTRFDKFSVDLRDIEIGKAMEKAELIPWESKLIARRQSTGLKDRKGVEIYESDLIEVCGNKNGALTVEFTNAYIGGWVLTHRSSDNHLSLGARKQETIEVIGSIHENPELLK